MDHITVRHIVEAVSGTLLCGDADTELKHISIDSRSMRGADLFVPLIGEKSDAHRFLVQAMDNGAAAALTSEHEAAPEGFHERYETGIADDRTLPAGTPFYPVSWYHRQRGKDDDARNGGGGAFSEI